MRRETLWLRPLALAAPGTGDGSGAEGGQVPAQFPQGQAPDRTLRCGPSSPPCQLCLLCGRALRWLSPQVAVPMVVPRALAPRVRHVGSTAECTPLSWGPPRSGGYQNAYPGSRSNDRAGLT